MMKHVSTQHVHEETNLVTEGILGTSAAFTVGTNVFASNNDEATLANTLRRSNLLLWLGLEEEDNAVIDNFGVVFGGDMVENAEIMAMPSIKVVAAIVSSGRSFMVGVNLGAIPQERLGSYRSLSFLLATWNVERF
jgi:hypothetical protein